MPRIERDYLGERELPDDGILIEQVGLQLPAAGQHAQGNRQIERRRLFRQFRRSQINHDPVLGPLESRIDDRPLDPVRTLLDRRLGQSDQHRFGQRAG